MSPSPAASPFGAPSSSDAAVALLGALLPLRGGDPGTLGARVQAAARAMAATPQRESAWDAWARNMASQPGLAAPDADAVVAAVLPHLPSAALRLLAAPTSPALANALADALADDHVALTLPGRVAALGALLSGDVVQDPHRSAVVHALTRCGRAHLKKVWQAPQTVTDPAAQVALVTLVPLGAAIPAALSVADVADAQVADATARRVLSVLTGTLPELPVALPAQLGNATAALTHPAAGTSPALRRRLRRAAVNHLSTLDTAAATRTEAARTLRAAGRAALRLALAHTTPEGIALDDVNMFALRVRLARHDPDLLGPLLEDLTDRPRHAVTTLLALAAFTDPRCRDTLQQLRPQLDVLVSALETGALCDQTLHGDHAVWHAVRDELVARARRGDVPAFRRVGADADALSDDEALDALPWQAVTKARPQILGRALVRIDALAGGHGVNLFLRLSPTHHGSMADLEAAVVAAMHAGA